MACPNKNTKLYKELSNQFSEDNINLIWEALTTEKFDKWYGTRKRDSDGMPLINKFLEVYNSRMQSVSLFKVINLQSENDVNKLLSSQKVKGINKFNTKYYITKNNREAGVRLYKILNVFYPGLLRTNKYWKNTNAIGISDKSEPVIELEINPKVLEKNNGVLFSPERVAEEDTLLPEEEKVTEITAKKEIGVAFIINRLKEYGERIYNDLRNENSKPKDEKNNIKIEKLKKKLADIKEGIDELQDAGTLTNIADIANLSLEYVTTLLKNEESLDFEQTNEIGFILDLYKNIDRTDNQNYSTAILTKDDLKKVPIIDKDGNIIEDITDPVKNIQNIARTAKELKDIFDEVVRNQIVNAYNNRFDRTINEADIFENIKDIAWGTKMFRDTGSAGNELLNLLHSIHADAERVARQETINDQARLKEVSNALNLKGNARVEFMKKLWQRDENGNTTGGLINRYTASYWKIRSAYHTAMNSSDKAKIEKAKRNHYNNHEYVNYFKDEAGMEAEISRLSIEFGETYAREIVEVQDVMFQEYRDRLQEYSDDVNATNMSKEDKQYDIEMWIAENNPDNTIANLKNGTITTDIKNNNRIIRNSFEFVKAIPKKVDRQGKETNFYDSVYAEISSNPEQLAYYEFVRAETKRLLSFYPQAYLDAKGIHSGFIPTLKKKLIDEYRESGMLSVLKKMPEVGTNLITTKVFDKANDHITPEGNPISSLNIGMLSPNYTYDENGQQIVDVTDVITDLDEVLNQFIPVTNLYKHKAKVEAKHRAVVGAIEQVAGVMTTPKGALTRQGKTDESYKKELKHLKEMIAFADDTFYGTAEAKKEHASKDKKLTSNEKKIKDELQIQKQTLETALENSENLTVEEEAAKIRELAKIEKELDNLGKSYSYTKGVKSILRYFQLLSQGWSLTSPAIELMYGYMSNTIHSRGGVDYTNRQFRTAFRIANLAVLPGSRLAEPSKKFKALIQKFDVVGDVAELEKKKMNHSKDGFSVKRFISPYEMMRNSDMVSKGSVMVATLMNTNLEGNPLQKGEVSLWDAYDTDGKLKEKYKSDTNIEKWELNLNNTNELLKLSEKISQINKRNHGNYDPNSPILANTSAGGKALLQFRRWMLEGFATRFEGERRDEFLGRDVKGRYVTYKSLYKTFGGGKKGTAKTMSIMFQALTHRMMFSNISSEKLIEAGITDLADHENIRKNASGLMWVLTMYMMLLMLKAAFGDDDDKDVSVAKFLLNQGGRLQQDLWFYADPSTTSDITKNFIPSVKLIDKIKDWGENVYKTVTDSDPEYNSEYTRGEFKGSSKVLIKTFELTPLAAAGVKTIRNMSKVYD